LFENQLLRTEKYRPRLPEQRGIDVMLARILIQTIDDFIKGDYWSGEDVAGRDGQGIFSFPVLCSHFGLDQDKVRAKIDGLTLKKWKRIKRTFAAKALRTRGK